MVADVRELVDDDIVDGFAADTAISRQEKQRLFFPLHEPKRVRADVILRPVGVRPMMPLQ